MTRDELLSLHAELFGASGEKLRVRNPEFAPEEDALQNHRSFGAVGLLVRMSDNLAKMRQRVNSGDPPSEDERKTVLNTLNYLTLYWAWRQQEERERTEAEPAPVGAAAGVLAAAPSE